MLIYYLLILNVLWSDFWRKIILMSFCKMFEEDIKELIKILSFEKYSNRILFGICRKKE